MPYCISLAPGVWLGQIDDACLNGTAFIPMRRSCVYRRDQFGHFTELPQSGRSQRMHYPPCDHAHAGILLPSWEATSRFGCFLCSASHVLDTRCLRRRAHESAFSPRPTLLDHLCTDGYLHDVSDVVTASRVLQCFSMVRYFLASYDLRPGPRTRLHRSRADGDRSGSRYGHRQMRHMSAGCSWYARFVH